MRHKRHQARARRGRFVRNTPENTLGMHIAICDACRSFNPYSIGEPMPEVCHRCNARLVPEKKSVTAKEGCPECGQSGPQEPFLDPYKFNHGLLCRACGRDLPEEGQ